MRRGTGMARRQIANYTLGGLAALLLLAGLAYGGVCLWFTLNARSFVFFAVPRISTAPQDAALNDVAEVTIRTEDGERLYGWWRPPAPGHGVVIVLCGKGVIVSDEAGLFGDLAAQGHGVLAIEYRGNGVSTGTPTEAG